MCEKLWLQRNGFQENSISYKKYALPKHCFGQGFFIEVYKIFLSFNLSVFLSFCLSVCRLDKKSKSFNQGLWAKIGIVILSGN